MKLLKFLFAVIIAIFFVSARLPSQTATNGVLAGWDFHTLTNGLNNYGASPFPATILATNLLATGLIRGSGVGTVGTGPNHGWGGNNFLSADYAGATNAVQYFTFGFTATNGFNVSLTKLSEMDYRRAGTGPPSGALEYQVGKGPFVTITNLTYVVNPNNSLGSVGPVDLSGIAALQNVPGGTNVTFRVVSWGGGNALGSLLFYDVSNSTALDVILLGTLAPNLNFLTPYDSGPGFFSGENLILTNNSGIKLYVWSSPTPAVSVTNWTLEGQMSELPLGTSGSSRYGFNLNPTTSPVYYIFAKTNTGLFTATEPLAWLTTADFVSFNVTTTNAGIRADGVFGIPAPPVLLASPANTNVFAGRNTSLSAVASASGPVNFQWFQNVTGLVDGTGLAGSQSNVLSFLPATTNQTGWYFVVITNQLGAVTSSAASFTVVALPSLNISNSPGGFVLSAGNGAVSNSYIIQSTTNLAPPIAWSPLQTNVIGANGQIFFTDTNHNFPGIFYRVQFP